MKRSILLTVILAISFVRMGIAAEISIQQAAQAALNICRIHGQISNQEQEKSLHHIFSRYEEGMPVYHVYGLAGKPGFIIIAADDNVTPVLAYSFESDLETDPELQPPPVRNWLDFYAQQIVYVKQNDLKSDSKIQEEWTAIMKESPPPTDAPLASVAPMTTTLWAQGCFYNAECPATGGVHPAGPCDHVVVGCVATAMAMAMKYWDFPARGMSSNSYTDPANTGDPSYGTVSATFNYAYDWDNMPNTVSSANTDVAMLGFHAGVAVEMNYSYNSSGAWPVGSTEVADAFKNYFYYSSSTTDVLKASYTDAAWKTLMKGELNAGRVLVYGSDGTSGGHAYIVDGYDDNYLGTGNLYFHFNWGWSGTSNGYFQLSNLNPGGGHLTNNQEAIINLEPKPVNLSYDATLHSATITGTDVSLSLQIESTGTAPAAASELGYYLSSNTIISQLDYLIGTDPVILLTPGSASNESLTVDALDVTPTIQPGLYYVGYLIDHNNDVEESSEGDNDYYLASPQVTVTCKAPASCTASDGVYYNMINVGWASVDYATHYRVYRNTINSTEFAIAVSDWQTGTTFQDYTALPTITYYYFVKAATSATGTYAGPLSPGGSGYHLLETITEDQTYNPTTTPRYYGFNNPSYYWNVAGIRPDVGSDWDIYLYSGTDYDDELAGSEYGTSQVDFVVMDGNHAGVATRGLSVSRYSGSGNATLEWEGGANSLYTGTNSNIVWPAGDVVEMWDTYLYPGLYRISLEYNSGTANLDLGIFQSTSSYYFSRSGLLDYSNYTGTTNESMLITITTEDYYGILVWANDANAANFNIKIEMAGTWQGDVSTNWNTPGNWSADFVPNATLDALIPAGCPNYPNILTDSARCHNLTINPMANISVGGAYLRVYGDMNCAGTFNQTSTSSDLYVHGNIIWNSGSTATAVGAAEMFIYGIWTFEDGSNVNLNAGYVEFRGDGNSYIRSYDANSALYHIRNSKNTGYELGFSALSTTNQHINGNIYNYAGKFLRGYSSFTTVIAGMLQNLGGTFQFGFGAVEFSDNPVFTLKPTTGSYFNDLILNSASGQTLSLASDYSDSLVVNNDLTILAGTLSPGSMNIVVGGDWDNQIYPDGFTEGTSTVHFQDGPWHQYVSSEVFYHLVVNKPAGGAIRMDGSNVTCTQYDWTGGGVDVLSGSFTAGDLFDNGIFGDYYVNPGGEINVTNNDGYVDLDGNLYIYGGSFNVYGGTTASYWPYYSNASLTLYPGGTLDFKNQGIYMFNTGMASMTYNITGGTIRTVGSLTGNHPHFHPPSGTFEFYGPDPCGISLDPDAAFNNLLINKGVVDATSPQAVNPWLNKLKNEKLAGTPAELLPLSLVTANTDLDINGDFNLQNGSFAAPDQMTVAGHWINAIGESAFLEGGGTVIFDSSESKSIYSDEVFFNLRVNKTYIGYEGLILDYNRTVGVLGYLFIEDGTFELNSYSTLDVDDYISINPDAGLNAGGFDVGINIYCSGDWINQNTLPTNTILGFTSDGSTVTFDDVNLQHIMTNGSSEVFNNLTINKLLGTVLINDNLVVTGDLNIIDGSWQNNAPGLTHQFYGDFTVSGSWNNMFFSDAIVEFKGLPDNTISYTGTGFVPNVLVRKSVWTPGKASGDPNAEPVLTIPPAALDLSSSVLLTTDFYCNNLTIDSGTVDLNSHMLSVTNSLFMNNVEGALDVDAGAILELGALGLNLSGGMVNVVGTAANKAQVRPVSAGTFYPFHLQSGYFGAKNAVFTGTNTMGVDIYSGLTIDSENDFDSCVFRNGEAGGVLLGIDDQSMDIYGAAFPSNAYGSNYNVRKYYDAGIVNFIGHTGSFSGSAYEYDIYNRVNWYGTLTVSPAALNPAFCPGGSTVLLSNAMGGVPPLTFAWSPATDLNNALIPNPIANPSITTIYTVTATDALGNIAVGSIEVVVWDVPVADAGSDVSITIGTSTTLNGSATGGAGPYTYSWMPPVGLSNTMIPNPVASPLTTTTYILHVSDIHLCASTDEMVVTVLPVGGTEISGLIRYDNGALTGLSNVTISLSQSGTILSTTTSDATGYYEFTGLSAGTYDLSCTSTTPWGGVNSADALLVLKHFVHLVTLTGLKLTAADVDASGGINSIDALLCAKRFTGMVTSFASGDWAFDHATVIASGAGTVITDLEGICYGDANGSYIPPYKTEPAVYLSMQNEMQYTDPENILVPVRIQSGYEVGSASLVLSYPADDIEILDVMFNKDNQYTLFKTLDGNIRIAWYTLNPMQFDAGDVLFSLQIRMKNPDADLQLTAGFGSELSDPMAVTLPGIELTWPKLIPASSNGLSLSQAVPNPASDNTVFTLDNPEQNRISCTVFSPDGKAILHQDFGMLDPGIQSLKLDIGNLSQGTYACVFEMTGSQGNQTLKRNIMVVK